MRNFVLVLLLINALAFIYQRWIISPDNPIAATHIEQDYPRLTTVQLAPRPQPGDAADVTTASGDANASIDSENDAKCIKIGPITQKADADSLAATLAGRGLAAALGQTEGQVWVGHWVQVVGLNDRAAAERARGRLITAGLSDAYIVTGGEELKISLGVFRATPSADRTIRRAGELGFETRMDDRYQPGTQYWLTVTMTEGRELRLGELRGDAGQILRTEPAECPANG
ncbi:MAG: hypothetical protein HKN56_03630 [Gammaproteobacteria bacterium]|nr:hypothetical protein [Gammaproteobacteria bacterium]